MNKKHLSLHQRLLVAMWIKTILLTKEKLPLGLNDSDYYLEECFQEIGCRISYSTRYYVAYVYLQPV